MNIISVEPIYTGGNIYLFLGESESCYFLADDSNYDVRLFDADPRKVGDDAFSAEWQDEHIVSDLDSKAALKFFAKMLQWICKHKPKGNYFVEDMEEALKSDVLQ